MHWVRVWEVRVVWIDHGSLLYLKAERLDAGVAIAFFSSGRERVVQYLLHRLGTDSVQTLLVVALFFFLNAAIKLKSQQITCGFSKNIHA